MKSREDISAQIEEVRFCLNNTDADGHLQNRFITCFQQYKDTETLTTEIVDNVLEKILVYPGGRLEVHWNYREEFEKLVSDLNLGGDSDE